MAHPRGELTLITGSSSPLAWGLTQLVYSPQASMGYLFLFFWTYQSSTDSISTVGQNHNDRTWLAFPDRIHWSQVVFDHWWTWSSICHVLHWRQSGSKSSHTWSGSDEQLHLCSHLYLPFCHILFIWMGKLPLLERG